MQNCRNCRFGMDFKWIGPEANPATPEQTFKPFENGYCHRGPPKLMESGNTSFPPIPPLFWCGEWRSHGIVAALKSMFKAS